MTWRTPLLFAIGAVSVFGYRKTFFRQPVDIPISPPIATIEPTVQPTATPKPTITPTPKPTAVPTPTPRPQPEYRSQEIYQMIDKYSAEKGVNPNVIRHIALCESGFNPKAKTYIYGGLFQYAPATWKSYRQMTGADPDPDLRFDAREAIKLTVYIVSLGRLYHWPNCAP